VIAAAQSALQVAKDLAGDAEKRGFGKNAKSPLLMVSLNDGEDPHFRKAEFNSAVCPTDCDRPCEKICPVQAIVFNDIKNELKAKVNRDSRSQMGRVALIARVKKENSFAENLKNRDEFSKVLDTSYLSANWKAERATKLGNKEIFKLGGKSYTQNDQTYSWIKNIAKR